MKKVFIVAVLSCLTFFVDAQTNTFPASGNVGIGTVTPISALHVAGNISLNAATDVNNTYLLFQRSSDGYIGSRIGNAYAMNGYQGHLVFETNAGGSSSSLSEQMRITANGNVGIGTTTPTEKLSVNGKIRAHEIKVEAANWPDYVFEQDYKVLGLQELDAYIKQHKHLPDMPSAKETETNGIELGEMNKLLLKKVEELTLHLIEKDKAFKIESAVNIENHKRIGKTEKELAELKEMVKQLMKK